LSAFVEFYIDMCISCTVLLTSVAKTD